MKIHLWLLNRSYLRNITAGGVLWYCILSLVWCDPSHGVVARIRHQCEDSELSKSYNGCCYLNRTPLLLHNPFQVLMLRRWDLVLTIRSPVRRTFRCISALMEHLFSKTLGCNWLLYKIELTSACCTCVSVFLHLYPIKAKSAKEKQQHKTRTGAVMDTQLHGTVLSPFFTAIGLIGELGRWPETNHIYGRDLLICTIKMRRFIITKRLLRDLNQTGKFFHFLWDLKV